MFNVPGGRPYAEEAATTEEKSKDDESNDDVWGPVRALGGGAKEPAVVLVATSVFGKGLCSIDCLDRLLFIEFLNAVRIKIEV